MSLLDLRHSEERVQTRRRELSEGRAPFTGARWIWTAILVIVLAFVLATVTANEAGASAELAKTAEAVELVVDPGDQSWFLCIDHQPAWPGNGYIYNDFMVSSTIAQCFIDYSAPPPGCPHAYRYQVWWTPQYGGWTGPHRTGDVCA